ncbi:hypothetical protein [Nocardia asteroides]|uniref:hypothetical protein n=1 Tax=Nocardia asteroides TaxID=1824 RepID=UPI001E566A5A|nr:hypothetical protein [Nocardia asteroides]UGT60881.1 hypothetical protein LTT61_27640 [Nocardia asteroides]
MGQDDRLREQPEFCDQPAGSDVLRYKIGEDHWTEGYDDSPEDIRPGRLAGAVGNWARKTARYVVIGLLLVVDFSPVAAAGLVIFNQIRIRVDPPREVQHATAAVVSGFEEVSLTKADLGGLLVTKVYIGPVVDRPQDRITSPGAGFIEMNKPSPANGKTWLVHGNYRDGCFVSIDRVEGGAALRGINGLSDSQRSAVLRGEQTLLEMRFGCGER